MKRHTDRIKHRITVIFALVILIPIHADALEDGVYHCVIDQAFGIDEPEFPIVTNWILKDKKFMFRKVGESFTFGQRGTVQAMPNAIITIHKDSPDVYFKDHLIATQTNFNGLITLVVVEDEFALTEITIHPNKEKDIDVKTGVCERF